MKRACTGLLAVAAVLGLAGCSGDGDPPAVAAVVEGTKVKSSETEQLLKEYEQERPDGAKQVEREELRKIVLDYQIKLALLEHLAADMGVMKADAGKIKSADIPELNDPHLAASAGQMVREARAGKLSKALAAQVFPDVDVSDEALMEEYERRRPLLQRNWKAAIQVARFASRADADLARTRAQEGQPFGEAANSAGAQGVGSIELNPLVAPLSPQVLDVIGGLQAGELSQPLDVDGGHVLVLVERREEVSGLTIEDLRPELTVIVAERLRFEQFQKWFDKQSAQADISVDPEYGTWSKERGQVT